MAPSKDRRSVGDVHLAHALQQVRQAPFVVDVLANADHLARAAAGTPGPGATRLLTAAALDPGDQLTAVAATHALAQVFDDEADGVLSDLLSHDQPFLREHAAWALASRLPRLDAVPRLVGVVVAGGFSGMLAQRTLQHWAVSADEQVTASLVSELAGVADDGARARLVETLGLVPGPTAARLLAGRALDEQEAVEVRSAALAALGTRPGDRAAVDAIARLARSDDPYLADVARLAADDLGRADREAAARTGRSTAPGTDAVATSGGPPTVAQLFLHADIDRGLTSAGAGDNGGVATLLVSLGDALVTGSWAGQVLTLSRGSARDALAALRAGDEPHRLVPVPLLCDPLPAAQAWPARVAAQRGIRRALTALGRVDVLHLRMADVGSMAAADVAAELGIPFVFTLAPDPHVVVHALDMTGSLTRANFGAVDAHEHYWFRARLVERLARAAAHTVLFPRPELRNDLRDLLGIDVDAHPARHTVVPEGIDLTATDAARAASGPALRDLEDLVAALPEHRHGLPLAVSVGRLHRVKGAATVVEAWARDPALRGRCNLVLVGGDLERPSADEQGQLDLVASVLAANPGAEEGLVLAGHRPHAVAAQWLAAAHTGRSPLVGPDGVYVCGSLKEEFGLAVVEALAAGLVVVAPGTGGPATYVEDGVTGFLVDTRVPADVGRGLGAALDLAATDRGERVARAYGLVRDRYTVQAMARALAGVYAGVGSRSASRSGRR